VVYHLEHEIVTIKKAPFITGEKEINSTSRLLQLPRVRLILYHMCNSRQKTPRELREHKGDVEGKELASIVAWAYEIIHMNNAVNRAMQDTIDNSFAPMLGYVDL
jgi:hypothetical protein